MATFKEVTSYLESIAPLSLQESYDNAGLIVGNSSEEVTGILVSLDCTEDIIDEAIRHNCNLIISHHPVIFSGIKKLNGSNYVERTVIKAIQNKIGLYAIHTNLDNVHNGVNRKICDRLGLKDARILSPGKNLLRKLVTFSPKNEADQVREALFAAGAGHIGNYDECSFSVEGAGTFRGSESTNPFVGEKGKRHTEPEARIEMIFPAYLEAQLIKALLAAHPYEEVAYDIYPLQNTHQNTGGGMIGWLEKEMTELEFLDKLKSTMGCGTIRHTKLIGSKARKIAVCGGSGSFLLKEAMAAGADFFVTSDFKYHQFFDAEGQIVIADIGHYESEHFTSELLKELLVRNFSTFAVRLTELVTNPVYYY